MDKKLGQEPAFPSSIAVGASDDLISSQRIDEGGMSTRLYIATKAMQALITTSKITVKLNDPLEPIPNSEVLAILALNYADALLNEEEK